MLAPLQSKAAAEAGAKAAICAECHPCLIFDDPRELTRRARHLLAELDPSSTLLVLVSNAAQMPGAVDVGFTSAPMRLVAAGSLGMCDMPISLCDILDRLSRLVGGWAAEAEETVVFLDMTWLLNTPSGIANQGEFEVALHQRLDTLAARVVCLYNGHYFPETMLLDALRTHPSICTDGGLRLNPHYLPPAALLRGDHKAQLQAWLQALGPAVGATVADLPGAGERVLEAPADADESGGAAGVAAGTGGEAEHEIALRWPASRPAWHWKPDAGLPREPQSAVHRWKIRCLGGLRVYRGDGSPVCWEQVHGATIKNKTVFAVLLGRGEQGAAAEELADLLWPDAQSTEQGLNRLYHTIHCLRAALEPGAVSTLLGCRDHRYYLSLPEGTWTDVPLFEQFCRRGEEQLRAGALDSALAFHESAERLYGGSLFADIPLKYIDHTEHDWCWSRRYWLEQMFVKMLTCSASIHFRLGDYPRAVAQSEKALKLSPCLETAHCEIMRAFHKLGRRDAFERQFRLCRDALRRFEDRAPSSETRVLYNNLVFN